MLTEREIEDLVKEWKPEPLVPEIKVCPPFLVKSLNCTPFLFILLFKRPDLALQTFKL